MTITITRRLASQLRSVFRRAFGNSRTFGPALFITAGPEGLSARARCGDIAVEYHDPDTQADATEELWLPYKALADCEGKKDEPVDLQPAGPGHVTAQWRDGAVPQIVQYDAPKASKADEFPDTPDTFVENAPALLGALRAAAEVTDPTSVRYALGCIQWRGVGGALSATDGRQLLVQSGYQFPWQEDLLVPASPLFAAPQLAQDQPVLVGRRGNWVAVRIGRWTVLLGINTEGKFPKVEDHIASPEAAVAHCRFSEADARFLAETLPRLPCDDRVNAALTLDINGEIALRCRAADKPEPTEVVLAGSECSGEPIRLNTDRQYLMRAIKLGFQELYCYGPEVPLICRDDRRQYMWAPLSAEGAIPHSDSAIRIVSPAAGQEATVSQPQPQRRTKPVSQPVNNATSVPPSNGQANTNGHAKANGQARRSATSKPSQQDLAGLIEQTEVLRTALRESLLKTNELLKGIKRHRKLNRSLQTTLASLRQLKTLGV